MHKIPKTNKKKNKLLKKKILSVVFTAISGAVLVVALLEATNRINLFGGDTNEPNITLNEHTKGQEQPSKTAPKNGNSSSSNQGGTATSQKTGDAPTQQTQTLLAPEGTFVSNHRVSLSANAQDTQQSTCTTTPGATCRITFTKDDVVKQLPAKTTDVGGGAYWTWKLGDIGFTKGSWKITATATLNGQTKTTEDSLNLEVSD